MLDLESKMYVAFGMSLKSEKEALIRFKVENSWLGSNNLAGSDIKMVQWDGSKWVQIDTSLKTSDTTYTYYEAKTNTFSVFAITGLKGGIIVSTVTPAVAVTETVKPIVTATTPAPAPRQRKLPDLNLCFPQPCCALFTCSDERDDEPEPRIGMVHTHVAYAICGYNTLSIKKFTSKTFNSI